MASITWANAILMPKSFVRTIRNSQSKCVSNFETPVSRRRPWLRSSAISKWPVLDVPPPMWAADLQEACGNRGKR